MTVQVLYAEVTDMLMPQDDQNVKPSVDSLMFVMEMYVLQTYLGINLIARTPIAQNLAGKNML